jgi:hypothetical protein
MVANGRRQLRAYLFIDSGAIEIRRTEQGRMFLTAFIQFKNFGQTPAYNVTQWVRMDILEKEPEEYLSADGHTSAAVGPGAVTTSPVNQGPVTKSDIDDINGQRKIVSIWGEITYRDAFRKKRYFRFYSRSGEPIPDRGWQLIKADKPDEAN